MVGCPRRRNGRGPTMTGEGIPPGEHGPELGARLLDDVRAFIERLCVMPDAHALVALTLWAVHTHMPGQFSTTPRLALLSPEPSSGKTRVLEVLELLTRQPLMMLSASPAAIFRTLANDVRTLLFDEVDTIWSYRGRADGNEDLRALMNAGYRRGMRIPRCVGPKHDVRMFPVFAPLALAGLGELPDTIMSRAVVIRMRKRLGTERIEQFRFRIHEPQGLAIRERLDKWARENEFAIGRAWPEMPPGIEDRPAEVWEPLLAIADAAGGQWAGAARAACVELSKPRHVRQASLRVRLLTDLKAVFGNATALSTAEILERLRRLEEAPWSELSGKPLGALGLARLLGAFDVSSTKVKVNGRALQGYRREHLADAWERYVTPTSESAEPPEPPAPHHVVGVGSTVAKPREVPAVPASRDSDSGQRPGPAAEAHWDELIK